MFSDVRTPGPIGGFELARIIGVTWPRVRVLLTSGDAGDQPSDLRVSATFIPKPWRAEDILAWVERRAGRPAGAGSGPSVIGPGGDAGLSVIRERPAKNRTIDHRNTRNGVLSGSPCSPTCVPAAAVSDPRRLVGLVELAIYRTPTAAEQGGAEILVRIRAACP